MLALHTCMHIVRTIEPFERGINKRRLPPSCGRHFGVGRKFICKCACLPITIYKMGTIIDANLTHLKFNEHLTYLEAIFMGFGFKFEKQKV